MLWGGRGGAWCREGFFVPGGATEIPGGERCGGSWSCLMNGDVLWGRKEGKRGKTPKGAAWGGWERCTAGRARPVMLTGLGLHLCHQV